MNTPQIECPMRMHGTTIPVSEPRSAAEERAADAAITERIRADRYEVALRSALSQIQTGHPATAASVIMGALLR